MAAVAGGATAAATILATAGPAAPQPVATRDIQPTTGTATFTDLTGGGTCSFPGEPPDNLHVGISSKEYGTADVCGAYLDVHGPRGTVRVEVTDRCTRCRPGLLDLSRRAFARIADVGQGQVPVTYALARNPSRPDPMSVRVKAGSSPWYLQLQVLDHGNALTKAELATGPGTWRTLPRTTDNQWTAANPGPGNGPFILRITDVYGQDATVYGIRLAPGEVQHTVTRLYQPTLSATPALPAPPAPPATAGGTSPADTIRPDGMATPPIVTPPGSRPTGATSTVDADEVAAASRPRPTGSRGAPASTSTLVSVLTIVAGLAVATRLYLRRQRRPSGKRG